MTIAAAEFGMIGFAEGLPKKPAGLMGEQKMRQLRTAHHTADAQAVRPFRVNVPEAALVDLRRCIAGTRWPERETVTDDSQGVRLATIQDSRTIGQQTTTGASARRD